MSSRYRESVSPFSFYKTAYSAILKGLYRLGNVQPRWQIRYSNYELISVTKQMAKRSLFLPANLIQSALGTRFNLTIKAIALATVEDHITADRRDNHRRPHANQWAEYCSRSSSHERHKNRP